MLALTHEQTIRVLDTLADMVEALTRTADSLAPDNARLLDRAEELLIEVGHVS